MTNPETYWLKYASQNAKMERLAYYILIKAFQSYMQKVADRINKVGAQQTLVEMDFIFNEEGVRQAYQDIYYQVGLKHKRWTDEDVRRRFKRKKEEDDRQRRPNPLSRILPKPKPVTPPVFEETNFSVGFFNQQWLNRLKNIVNSVDITQRIASVTETVKKRVVKSIQESLQIYVSPLKIIAKLRRDAGSSFIRERAEMIVRTEVTHITNISAEQSAVETGLDLVKVWIATKDDKTRDTHRAVGNRRPIKANEKFNVGGYMMERPGDSSAPISQVANCRCVVAFLPADDYEDLF
ncbi:phage head morphogenesis protein [Dyadobacter chenwenxiniae]|uniref:Phage head morphogenesis protein n=1 Tax=Dyadobacter chenwenxiniae TaxID=2906456 RepID=A0A9X1TD54_9BACT|nr:phage minor head protein [Dyadobacter chenwenxiniae]MCF0059950.1 phage head morphogenesis protein [Dyadobacter chenwenxiniae]UON85689.1 phage head morphogenesis protein [Dyadobacter chenwenxiniae]